MIGHARLIRLLLSFLSICIQCIESTRSRQTARHTVWAARPFRSRFALFFSHRVLSNRITLSDSHDTIGEKMAAKSERIGNATKNQIEFEERFYLWVCAHLASVRCHTSCILHVLSTRRRARFSPQVQVNGVTMQQRKRKRGREMEKESGDL